MITTPVRHRATYRPVYLHTARDKRESISFGRGFVTAFLWSLAGWTLLAIPVVGFLCLIHR